MYCSRLDGVFATLCPKSLHTFVTYSEAFLLTHFCPLSPTMNPDNMPSKIWKGVSENCRDFIDQCLTKNPRKRITATQAQMHPWVQEAGKVMATEEAKKPLSKSAMLSMMRFQETTMFEKWVGWFTFDWLFDYAA